MTLENYIFGKIAVFALHKNRPVPQLVLAGHYESAEEHESFTHWATAEFPIDLTYPVIDNGPPLRYA